MCTLCKIPLVRSTWFFRATATIQLVMKSFFFFGLLAAVSAQEHFEVATFAPQALQPSGIPGEPSKFPELALEPTGIPGAEEVEHAAEAASEKLAEIVESAAPEIEKRNLRKKAASCGCGKGAPAVYSKGVPTKGVVTSGKGSCGCGKAAPVVTKGKAPLPKKSCHHHKGKAAVTPVAAYVPPPTVVIQESKAPAYIPQPSYRVQPPPTSKKY